MRFAINTDEVTSGPGALGKELPAEVEDRGLIGFETIHARIPLSLRCTRHPSRGTVALTVWEEKRFETMRQTFDQMGRWLVAPRQAWIGISGRLAVYVWGKGWATLGGM